MASVYVSTDINQLIDGFKKTILYISDHYKRYIEMTEEKFRKIISNLDNEINRMERDLSYRVRRGDFLDNGKKNIEKIKEEIEKLKKQREDSLNKYMRMKNLQDLKIRKEFERKINEVKGNFKAKHGIIVGISAICLLAIGVFVKWYIKKRRLYKEELEKINEKKKKEEEAWNDLLGDKK